jgi:hypothetical protein
MKEKIKKQIEQIFYTNLEFSIGNQNRNLLASSKILSDLGIIDIDTICQLAKVMEQNSGLELSNEDFNIIYQKISILIKEHMNKPFDFLYNE